MFTRTLSRLIGLVLLAMCLLTAATPLLAQKKAVQGGPNSQYMNMRRTTKKQRQAAAQRNAQRKAAHGKKNQVGVNANKGGKK